ncbi:MAG: hypothetical protein LUM44_21160 [Pyrinomonadaceae bacterium]|nr:hypothetical protein [Pyrinomonadaceae bacterium]
MSQRIVTKLNNRVETLELPDPNEEVTPGVYWGNYTHLFTPACWKVLSWTQQNNFKPKSYRVGDNLTEEISACILGGYGIPSEVGLAAFHWVKEIGILEITPSEDEIYKVLAEPLVINERRVRYRFARQKSKYLSYALKKIAHETAPEDSLKFRSWLMGFEGIGYKTASWITRNWLHSDKVAIIDIHIHRAGLLMNLYNAKQTPAKNYLEMEDDFLRLATGIGVKASQLDVLIWQEMKLAGNMALRYIRQGISH